MSVKIPLDKLSIPKREQIINELTTKNEDTRYGIGEKIEVFKVSTEDNNNRYVSIPFSYAYQHPSISIGMRNEGHPKAGDYTFTIPLNSIQEEVKEEIYEILNRTRSILISLYTGAGKSLLGIFLASKLHYKTMILCHRLTIMDQWRDSITRSCPSAKVQIVKGKEPIKDDMDFYIMNITNVTKKSEKELKDIGVLMVDEAHCMCTDNTCQSLLHFYPKYLIGLTATPENVKNNILHYFYGSEWIVKKMFRPHNVYLIESTFKPEVKETGRGTLDWNSVLQSQAESVDFNQIIIEIIKYFRNRTFFILCKRKDQTIYLYKQIKQLGESVDIYIANAKKYDDNARILVSSYSKGGVGMDCPKMDALIIGSDVMENVVQYIGRVFRRENTVPMIFDILAKNGVMYKHYLTRKHTYVSLGGIVKHIHTFPEFTQRIQHLIVKKRQLPIKQN